MIDSAETLALQAIETARREGRDALDLHGLGLKRLPHLPVELYKVKRLHLSGNRLGSLPAELWQFEQLEHLDLANNRLRELDPGIGKLSRLRSLDLSENRLATLPFELSHCSQLNQLNLFGNLFTELPAAVLSLAGLVKLDLSRNRLESLPSFLGRFPLLEELDVRGNRIRELPTGLDTLSNMRVLNLSSNQLGSIDGLVSQVGIEDLYLDDNALEHIPVSLAQLPLLRRLSVDGNPLGAMPTELNHLGSSASRQPLSSQLRKMVSGGYEEGKRYFDAPKYSFDFSLALKDANAVVEAIDVCFKEFANAPAVSMKFQDGATVNLAGLTRKGAIQLVVDRQQTEKPSDAVFEFHPTNMESVVQLNCNLAERTMSRVLRAELIVHRHTPPLISTNETIEVQKASDQILDAIPPSGRRSKNEAGQPTDVPESDPVDTAVFCPPRVAKGSVFLVQVFLYPSSLAHTVEQQAQGADPKAENRGVYSLPLDLPRGTRVDIHLEMPTLSVDESDAVIIWRSTPATAQFEVAVPVDAIGPNAIGRVRFAVAGVPAGTLRFQVTIGSEGASTEPAAPREVEAVKYRRAFVSYASKDLPEVLRRVQAFKIAGLSVFQEILDIAPGERWEKRLYEEIDACDVFLLFWSSAAASSQWVQKEIDYALDRKKGDADRPPDIQPVPIEGPPIVLPPEKLRHLHFNDALLAQIRAAQKSHGDAKEG